MINNRNFKVDITNYVNANYTCHEVEQLFNIFEEKVKSIALSPAIKHLYAADQVACEFVIPRFALLIERQQVNKNYSNIANFHDYIGTYFNNENCFIVRATVYPYPEIK